MRVALVLPPLCQLNTPYPSTAYLARLLREHEIPVVQRDLGLELVLRLYSREGLTAVFDEIVELAEARGLPDPAWRALALRARHQAVIDPVVSFLQGADRTVAPLILSGDFLPAGPRVQAAIEGGVEELGPQGVDDIARHLATLHLADLADLVASTVDGGFGLARYGHNLATGPVHYDPIQARLDRPTLLDRWLDELCDDLLAGGPFDLVGVSLPFPGTLVGGLRIGRRLRAAGVHVAMGGGYVNTELRRVAEPRLWECVDSLCFDDGEGPLLALIEHLEGGGDRRHRTLTREGRHDAPPLHAPPVYAAWYGDLPLRRYLQVLDGTNPAHRLWSDGRWNKVTLAHGCYWRRCAFCDVNLDYIAGFAPSPVPALVDRVAELVQDTGTRGVHLVDEAAPPRLLRDFALELLARELVVGWWGNIRFEKAFTLDLCRLLAASGCVAVTGGLEVASDRLLGRMDKGIDIDQAARAAHAFRQAGVLVHAYLMYGFPTQTDDETVDSMEVVRQLFEQGLLDSAFWHRFVLTRHSAVYADPAGFAVSFDDPAGVFAANDLAHRDPSGGDHDRFDRPLVASLDAWMRGQQLDRPVHSWVPGLKRRSRIPRDRVERSLRHEPQAPRAGARLVWIGGEALEGEGQLLLHGGDGAVEALGRPAQLDWLAELIDACRPGQAPVSFGQARDGFPGASKEFDALFATARQAGLLAI